MEIRYYRAFGFTNPTDHFTRRAGGLSYYKISGTLLLAYIHLLEDGDVIKSCASDSKVTSLSVQKITSLDEFFGSEHIDYCSCSEGEFKFMWIFCDPKTG